MLETRCYAKINLWLHVVGKRPDGYHDLETLFREIDLADTLIWSPGSTPLDLHVEGANLGEREQNLVVKAASRFAAKTGRTVGGNIRLIKKIPAGGGLGGGSSDAAGMLKLLNRHFGNPMDNNELAALGAVLGSDVPFFLEGGCLLGRGRGTDLEPYNRPLRCPEEGFLFMPPLSLSTPKVFGACRPGPAAHGEPPIGENHLLDAALSVSQPFRNIYQALEPLFPEPFFMTGSGSSLVWLTGQKTLSPRQQSALERQGVMSCRFKFRNFFDF